MLAAPNDEVVARFAKAILRDNKVVALADAGSAIAHIESQWESERDPIEQAIVAATRFDRVAFAFAAGYLGAVRFAAHSLGAPLAGRPSLLATEAGGAHPRAVQTSLTLSSDGSGTLNGVKSFATLAFHATELCVIAKDGEIDGRPSLRAVRVPVSREGITMSRLPDTPFCPEIDHARVELVNVHVSASEIMSGDAYLRLIKPFRTIEDLFVLSTVASWLGATAARAQTPDGNDLALRALAAVLSLRSIAASSLTAPHTHLALDGAIALVKDVAAAVIRLPALPDEQRSLLERDQALLGIAQKARDARRARAYQEL